MWSVTMCIFLILPLLVLSAETYEEFKNERDDLLSRELDMMLGSDIVLNDNEKTANEIIMKLKHDTLENAFHYPEMFNMSRNFLDYKDDIKKTKLFKIIQDMPKGAFLHGHDTGLLSPDYVLELTYMDDLYVCFEDDFVHFLFSYDIPSTVCASSWQLLKDVRFSSGNVERFDKNLRKYFTMAVDNPNEIYKDINKAWSKFQQYFIVTTPLLTYKPVWEKYFYDTLRIFREDNIMYIEIRSVLPSLYDLDGNVYDSVATAESYKKVLDQFLIDYPDFFGAKLIYAPMRKVNGDTVEEYINIAKEIKRRMPDFLAGFDLVGQEDFGVPTKEFLKELVKSKDELNYFFHAGETNWYGTTSDENIADVIVLGTKRIGHAFALVKHPLLLEEVRKRDIALEVNVVSNVVLKLVEDVRNHPLATFIALNLPVVISSDDPGVWEAEPLSHDFYITFMGVASKQGDIRLLKKLALNSLYYSSVSNKDKIIHAFEIRWTKFIDKVIKENI